MGGLEGYSTDLNQLGRLHLSSRFFRPVHLKCNQPSQLVQSADLQRPSLVMHCGQIQTLGPGLCSMPAQRRSSLSSESGTCLVVRRFKNTTQSLATVFSYIKIDGKSVPTVQNPCIIGVTLDPLFNFGAHVKQLKEKVNNRNNILKALAGPSWGKEKETLITTYKAIGGSWSTTRPQSGLRS